MDVPSGFRQPGQKKRGSKKGGQQGQRGQLFEDTSQTPQPPYPTYPPQYGQQSMPQPVYDPSGYGGPPQAAFPGQEIFNTPMANMAMQYGTTLADQGKDYVNKNLEKYVSSSKLKYYFAVDTAYVGKKLGLLTFPFTHSEWSIRFNQDEPVPPRFEINAPDLYIPVMAFVTYILVAGLVLGTQDRFTPEQLGIQASAALVWLVIELIAIMSSLYILNLHANISYLDVLAFLGYKFIGMIASLAAGMLLYSSGYYPVLLWYGITLVFFLVRTLRVRIQPHTSEDGYTRGNKRSIYLIISIAAAQPLLMWWLTRHIIFGGK